MTAKTKHTHLRVYLVGAPNCGKSTIFNRLTHAGVPVGNRSGVTVDKTGITVSGQSIGEGCPDFILTDLPGIRSPDAHGRDELVTLEALRREPPDLIINVLGATTLERCAGLTLSLRERYPAIPLIAAVNMCDELEREGITFSPDTLTRHLGVPCTALSATRGSGLPQLRAIICRMLSEKKEGVARRAYSKAAAAAPATGRGAAPLRRAPGASLCCGAGCAAVAARAAAAALSGRPAPHRPSDITDRYITQPAIGIPLLFAVLALIFGITFGSPGDFLTVLFERLILTPLCSLAGLLAKLPGFPPLAISFVEGCLLGGVGAALSFLPRIVLLFTLLSMLEDSGYISRAAFVLDPFLRRAGLSGRAFIPLLLGFGCSVSGVMAARSIEGGCERERCVACLPVLSCSARAPVYSLIATAFFPFSGWVAVLGVYLLGIAVFLAFSSLSGAVSKKAAEYFIAELPRFRMPRITVTLSFAGARAREFLRRAGGVIFLSSAAVWLLSSLTPSLTAAAHPCDSILATLSGFLAPLLSPLGFGNWQAAAALICGVGAKEGIISTLGVILESDPAKTLSTAEIFTPASALSFMVFSSMYIPCAATIPVMSKELGSRRKTAAALMAVFAVSYILSLAVYKIASLSAG